MAAPPKLHRGALGLVVRRPVAVLMVVLAVAVFGIVSFQKLPVTLLPDISYPTLTVRTEYEGAAPAEVEKLVTRPLEENLAVIGGLVSYRSISRAGVSDVILEFQWDTKMTFAAQDVREKVDQIKGRFPQSVEQPLILRYDPTLDPIMRLALYSESQGNDPGVDLFELRRTAEEDLKRTLESLPGVAAVRIRGGFEEEWRIELKEDRLKLRGISASDVTQRVGMENANVAGGVLRDGDRESLVRTLGEIKSIAQLRQLVVGNRGGEPIRISDLGTVERSNKERDIITRIDGRESVEIEVFKEAGANVVEVAKRVKAKLYGENFEQHLKKGRYVPSDEAESDGNRDSTSSDTRGGSGSGTDKDEPIQIFSEEKKTLAAVMLNAGIGVRMLSDQSVFIENSISEVRDAALTGAVLAILVLFAFLRKIKPTLIIGITIPISVVATFAPLFLAGVSLNIMSLGGLALGIGMLVDSAIVVLESISRRAEEGEETVDAAVFGTREVGLAVLASTLTTVAVFLPMVFVEGIAGEFFRDQALAVVFSLVAALIAALFFIPMLASRRLPTPAAEPALGQDQSKGIKAFFASLHGMMPWQFSHYSSVGTVRKSLADRKEGKRSLFSIIPLIAFDGVLFFIVEVISRTVLALIATVIGIVGIVVWAVWQVISITLAPLLWVFDRGYHALEGAYRLLLIGALRAKILVLVVASVLSFVAWQRSTNLGIELVPMVHQGEFTIETQLDVGTPVRVTDDTGRDIERLVREALADAKIPISGLATAAGVPRDVIAKAGEGKHSSKIHVRLDVADDLAETEERAIRAIRKRLADVAGIGSPVFTRPMLFSTKTSLEVEVVGPILKDIREVADRVEDKMRRIQGLTDIQSTNGRGYPELVIRPNRQQLTHYDLRAGSVANLIRDKVQGNVSTRITQGDRRIDVLVRTPRDEVRNLDDILNLRVNPGAEQPVSLATVASVDQSPGPSEIRRVGGERAVVLNAGVQNLDLSGAASRIEEAVDELRAESPELFREVLVRVAGQREESDRSLRSLLFAGLIAIFLVYIVMASQFESLVHPLVILFTIPLALVGVVFALEFLSMKVSIVVLIGVILLVGIVVNNAIVLVDCVNQRRRDGLDRDAALVEAGRLRLRPILMTTMTTVLGLLPLALGLGEGTEIRTPMAITVIAGLLTSTVLTLVVIPVVYALVSRAGHLPEAEVLAEELT